MEKSLPPHHQAVVDRFVAACTEDRRVLAAFLGGSYARGTADAHSDLDLGLIVLDEAYDDFAAGRDAFVRRLGEPVFLEDFDHPGIVFFIFRDGAEVELAYGRESEFQHIHSGPFIPLLDRTGLLKQAVFAGSEPAPGEQRERLRRLIDGFWHDLSHFITALARGQLWWAAGQLEQLRLQCVDLARLGHGAAAGTEGYEKVDSALPAEVLSPLQATFCPLEAGALLRAARVVVRFYQEQGRPLAQANGLRYPEALERVMVERLETL